MPTIILEWQNTQVVENKLAMGMQQGATHVYNIENTLLSATAKQNMLYAGYTQSFPLYYYDSNTPLAKIHTPPLAKKTAEIKAV